jgi:hypothetical protein
LRVLELAFAGVLALTVPVAGQADPVGSKIGPVGAGPAPNIVQVWVAMDRATIQCPTVGTVTGVEYPVPRANGTADQFRGAGGRMVPPAGLAVSGRASLLTGSGVLRAGLLIIPSLIGEGRLGAGAIRSQAS